MLQTLHSTASTLRFCFKNSGPVNQRLLMSGNVLEIGEQSLLALSSP